jgi:histidinol phosphatase-like enzyme
MTLYCMDMDGTLIEPHYDGGEEVQPYEAVKLLPGVYDRLQWLAIHDSGAKFSIITNQGGVAFGFVTEEQAYAKIGLVLAKLEMMWSRPISVHVCFNHPDAKLDLYRYDDPRRKPGPEMIHEAMRYHGIAHDTCCIPAVMTGDLPADEGAAKAAGVAYVDHDKFFQTQQGIYAPLSGPDQALVDSITAEIEDRS